MPEAIFGDNEEEFSHSSIDEALEMAWDGATLDTEIYTVWEGELTDQWIDTGEGEHPERVVVNVKERTFQQVKNLDSEYFDIENFIEIKVTT